MEKARELAIAIIEEMEALLDEKNIKIPSEDRDDAIEQGEDAEDLAAIYGTEYYDLEDKIVQLIKNAYDDDSNE